MPFICKATYKEEQRTISFSESTFPEYQNIQAKLRLAFNLPVSTTLHWWHAYFSSDGDNGTSECKYRRHVCNEEEYLDASKQLLGHSFPKPTLIFQVLTTLDPRLTTATKYHSSLHLLAHHTTLLTTHRLAAESTSRLHILVSALKTKQTTCSDNDVTAVRFWAERIKEKEKALADAREREREADRALKIWEQGRGKGIDKKVLEKEGQRVKDAKAEIARFLESWKATGYEASQGQAQSTRQVESPFPSLESLAGPNPNNLPLPNPYKLVQAGLKDLKDLKNAHTQVLTSEVKSVLDSFLVNLGSQLSNFEDGVRERLFTDERVVKGYGETRARSGKVPGEYPEEVEVKAEARGINAMKMKTIICDGPTCGGEQPKVVRWHCESCADFDVCYSCLPALEGFHDPSHKFKAVYHRDIDAKIIKAMASSGFPARHHCEKAEGDGQEKLVRHSAFCDNCSQRISGDRMKCIDCPDWDACSGCFNEVIHSHAGGKHNFVRLRTVTDLIINRRPGTGIKHSRIVCDGCDGAVIGVRYKCLHPDCADFDLCAGCEATGELHPQDHPMLKMQIPSQVANHSYFSNDDTPLGYSDHPTPPRVERELPVPIPQGAAPVYAKDQVVPSAQVTDQSADAPPSPTMFSSKLMEPIQPLRLDGKQEEMSLLMPVENTVTPAVPVEFTTEPLKARVEAVATALSELKAEVTESSPIKQSAEVIRSVCFVADVTVPDKQELLPSTQFEKIWRLRNTGNVVISPSATVQFLGGDRFGLESKVKGEEIAKEVQVGDEFDVVVRGLKAPLGKGVHVGYWRMVDAEGEEFGDRLWIEIVVIDEQTESLSGSSIVMPSMMGFSAPTVEEPEPTTSAIDTVTRPVAQSLLIERDDDISEIISSPMTRASWDGDSEEEDDSWELDGSATSDHPTFASFGAHSQAIPVPSVSAVAPTTPAAHSPSDDGEFEEYELVYDSDEGSDFA